MIRFFLAAFIILITFIGCTKKPKNLIASDSAFTFVYDKALQGTDFVAQLGEDKITTSQLLSPSPALIELEGRIQQIIIQKVYAQAKDGDTVTFAFEQPKEELKKIIGGPLKPEVTIQFDPKLQGGVAKINDTFVAFSQLTENDTLLARLALSQFEQKIRALEGLFARRKVLEASKAANMTMEQFIKEKIIGGDIHVTDADVDQFAKKNNLSEKDLTDDLRAQIKDTIMAHQREEKIADYVAKHLISDPIHIAFLKPTMTMANVRPDKSVPSKGSGPINVLLFSRFDCDDCRNVASEVERFVGNYPKYFTLSYLFNFPVNSNEERMVAEASMCIKKQNDDYFWKFVESFNPKSAEGIEEAVNQSAKSSGADYEAFRTCFLGRELKDQVESQLQATKDFGFYKTPVVVLDGKIMETPNTDEFVAEALALKAEKGLGFNLFYKIKQFFKNI